MANNYDVEVPKGKKGYPSQQYVDAFLNRIDDCPDCGDIDDLISMGEDAAQEYVREKFNSLQEEVNAYFAATFAKLVEGMTPMEKLTTPPTSIEEVIEYCKALVEYFLEPYKTQIEMVKFYSEFCRAAATAISAKANDLQCLTNLEVMIPQVPGIPIPDIPGVEV